MTRAGFLLVLLVSAAAVTLSASSYATATEDRSSYAKAAEDSQSRRIFTNPRPEPYFKTLFPDAGGFSTFGGTPLHYKVYGVDPKTNPNAPPIGFIFWTTDVVPNDYGYHGPIHFLVGMDTRGIIQAVVMDYNSEPYGYFSVDPPKFVEQFKNKSIRDPFQVGRDIAAVSRASITMNHAARVLRDSTRTMAKTFLTPDQIKPQQ